MGNEGGGVIGVVPPNPVPKSASSLAADAVAAMVGVGIPTALIGTCWAVSVLLCSRFLALVLQARWGLTGSGAVGVAALAVVVFLGASWLRMMRSGSVRAAGTGICLFVIAVWIVGAVAQAGLSDATPGLWALLSVAWCVVSCWAVVKLVEQYRLPGATNHLLYRFYRRNRVKPALYIGITNNTDERFRQHAETKTWWPEVAVIEIVHYPTREALAAAEKAAIIRERPIYNVQHNQRNPRRRVA